MQYDANPKYIVAYEVGFEGEINWDKPVVFNLAAIERIDKAEGGTAEILPQQERNRTCRICDEKLFR